MAIIPRGLEANLTKNHSARRLLRAEAMPYRAPACSSKATMAAYPRALANASGVETWPAAALHPTHTVYPGSDIKKCGTSEAVGIFDACRGLKSGESWSFQFNEVGTWKYHNHLTPTQFGRITVTE